MAGLSHIADTIERLADDVRSSAENRRVRISELKSDAHNLLERFDLEHQDMAKALKGKLTSDEAVRTEAVQQFMNGARSDVATRKLDVATELRRLDSEHQDMARALKEKLSSDEAIRSEAVQQFMNSVGSDVAMGKSEVATELRRLHSEHQDMARALKEKLSSGETTRREADQQFVNGVRSDVRLSKEATHQLMSELASDHRELQEAWGRLFGGIIREPAPEPVVEEAAPEPVAEEVVVEEAAPEPVAEEEEKADLSPKDQIVGVVTGHPEGIRLVDIGNELGVDWRSLIGSIKPLVDEARVEKIDNLYYPKG